MEKNTQTNKNPSTKKLRGRKPYFKCPVCGEEKYSFYQTWLCKERHKQELADVGAEKK